MRLLVNCPAEGKHVCGGLSAAGRSHSEHGEQEAELLDGSARPAAPERQQPTPACRHPGKPHLTSDL